MSDEHLSVKPYGRKINDGCNVCIHRPAVTKVNVRSWVFYLCTDCRSRLTNLLLGYKDDGKEVGGADAGRSEADRSKPGVEVVANGDCHGNTDPPRLY